VGTLFVGDKASGKDDLLVSWGCSNKLPGTGWFETTVIYSITSGGWKAEIRVQHGGVLVRALFWVVDCQLPIISLRGGKSELAPWFLPIRALIPFTRAPPS